MLCQRGTIAPVQAGLNLKKETSYEGEECRTLQKSGIDIPFQGPHCLRHSLAVRLLKNGTPLKTIGDILGHRTAESTSVYLRLATGDLREVSLPVPGKQLPVKRAKNR
jgi:integrase